MVYRKRILTNKMHVWKGGNMNKCESVTCENIAVYIFNWSVHSQDYTKPLCPEHVAIAEENLAHMGGTFSKQTICIMRRT